MTDTLTAEQIGELDFAMNKALEQKGGQSPVDAWRKVPMGLLRHLPSLIGMAKRYADLEETADGLEKHGDTEHRRAEKAEDFISARGYRRCDMAACNCGSWHGGNADDRLREIREVFVAEGIGNGQVLTEIVREQIRRAQKSDEWRETATTWLRRAEEAEIEAADLRIQVEAMTKLLRGQEPNRDWIGELLRWDGRDCILDLGPLGRPTVGMVRYDGQSFGWVIGDNRAWNTGWSEGEARDAVEEAVREALTPACKENMQVAPTTGVQQTCDTCTFSDRPMQQHPCRSCALNDDRPSWFPKAAASEEGAP